MTFIDSNILAYAFYENSRREACQNVIRAGGIINTLNLVESYNIIVFETEDLEYSTKAIKSLLKSNLRIVDINLNIIFESLKRTKKHKNLKFINLVHYTTAILCNCDEITSFDSDFDGLDIKRVTPV